MKKIYLRLLLLTLSVCLFSCQDNRLEDEVDILGSNGTPGKTYTMYLDATYPSFNGDDADAATRAQNNSWENGDVIYVRFSDGGTYKTGEGKYNSSTGKWTVKLDSGSLTERVTYPCSVYYLCDGTVSRSGDAISVDEFTAVYADMSAIYSVSQDEIGLTASLKSQTWRMAFKGEVGTEVTVLPESSIRYINKIDMSLDGGSAILYAEDKNVDLTVQNTGKTTYIYGVFSNQDNINNGTLTLQTSQFPSYQFTRSIAFSTLKNGESGIVTLPTSTNSEGKWTSKLNENVAILLDGKSFASMIKTVAAGGYKGTYDEDTSIEYIVFEANSSITDGTIITSSDSPKEAFANYSSATKTITISTQAERFKTPQVFSYAFYWCARLLQINGLDLLETKSTEDMRYLLYRCFLLRSLDVSKFETRNVTNMRAMFCLCHSLQSLDLSNFDTQNVTDMRDMFFDCDSLQFLDVSNFDTHSVTDMGSMFMQCYSLQSLDVSNFDTSNVKDMELMFCSCSSLQSLDVSKFDTHNVTNMSFMFGHCELLKTLDLSRFDTRYVTNMCGLFSGCCSLQILDVSTFDTRNVTDMVFMFSGCSSLQSLDLSTFDTRNVTDMRYMFSGCLLQSLDLSNFDTSNVTDMEQMFYNCSSLQSLDLSSFNTHNVTNMWNMFSCCSSLQTLNLRNFDTHNVTGGGMYQIFCGCSSLQTLDLSNFNIQNITTTVEMFRNCSSLQSLDLSSFDTHNVTDMRSMFEGCTSLQTLNLSSFDTQNVTNMQQMFGSCLQLKNLDISGFQTKNVTSMRDMFENCQSLETLNLDGFSTESLTEIGGMFYDCFALKQLYLGTSFILDKNASYDNYYNIVYGLAMDSKNCRISCPAVTKEFFLWMDIESKYIEWEILD